MASSLIKFINQRERDGQRLHWGRAERDGFPFRGEEVPLYTNEEYEEKVAPVPEPKNGIFDIFNPEQNRKYLEVLAGIKTGLFECLYVNRQFDREKRLNYIEWVEYYMEDGAQAPYRPTEPMEPLNGPPTDASSEILPPPPGFADPRQAG